MTQLQQDLLAVRARWLKGEFRHLHEAVRAELDWRYTESHRPWRMPDPFLFKG